MAHRVLIAQFMHETNTFSVLPTTLDDYRRRWLVTGEELATRFAGTRTEIGGLETAALEALEAAEHCASRLKAAEWPPMLVLIFSGFSKQHMHQEPKRSHVLPRCCRCWPTLVLLIPAELASC
jgi:hypothetical protein